MQYYTRRKSYKKLLKFGSSAVFIIPSMYFNGTLRRLNRYIIELLYSQVINQTNQNILVVKFGSTCFRFHMCSPLLSHLCSCWWKHSRKYFKECFQIGTSWPDINSGTFRLCGPGIFTVHSNFIAIIWFL